MQGYYYCKSQVVRWQTIRKTKIINSAKQIKRGRNAENYKQGARKWIAMSVDLIKRTPHTI